MISVIIPVFNAGFKLQRLLKRLKTQVFKDFEVILIDDGSTDESGMVCDSISEKDERFKVLHQNNNGVSSARNNGMSMASGDYIAFLDHDDDIPDNYLDELVRLQKNTAADIVVCDVAIIYDNQEVDRFTLEETVLEKKQALNYVLSRKKINSGPCGKLFSAKLIQDICFPDLKVYEDIIFVVKAFDKADTIAITNQTEYRYIQNDAGAMNSYSSDPSEDIIVATDYLIDYLNKKDDLSPQCIYTTVSHLFQYVQSIRKNSSYECFTSKVKALFARHRGAILKCSAFPWKEKAYYLLFSFGLIR